MNIKHIIYAIFPFVAGLIIKQTIFKESDSISYLFCLGISCVLSLFVYSKLILPNIESKYMTFSDQKRMNELNNKYNMGQIEMPKELLHNEEMQKINHEKTYSRIAWFHILLLIGLIASYFLK